MEPLASALIGAALASILYLFYQHWADDRRYPPGPVGLPVIGNLHQILQAGSIVRFIEQSRRKYGNVFTIKFGGFRKVVISSCSLMEEVFVKNAENTSERVANMHAPEYSAALRESPGQMWAPFPHWKAMRTFILTALREEGMGKSSLEPCILEEIQTCISAFIEPCVGKPLKMAKSFTMVTSNVISWMAFNQRFSYDDKMFQKLVGAVHEHLTGSIKAGMVKNLPFLKYLPGDPFETKPTAEAFRYIQDCLRQIIAEHIIKLDKESPKDYVDHYLVHMYKERENDPHTFFTEGNLVMSTFQLFVAGTDTTSTALQWAFLFMCLQPDVQSKVHKEIDTVIGSERPATYKDRLLMPYTDAVFHEILRIANIGSIGIPRKTNKDMIIDGKLIPGGTELMMNMSSVMFDAETFTEPLKFRPERFLDDDDEYTKKNLILPFGLGRRICPAASLAKMEFFLFLISILQRYSVSAPSGASTYSDPHMSIVRSPEPYEMVFTPRNLQ